MSLEQVGRFRQRALRETYRALASEAGVHPDVMRRACVGITYKACEVPPMPRYKNTAEP